MRSLILPPLRRSASDAERFARVVHAGQVDKAGRPYVEHLLRVRARVFRCSLEGRARDDAMQIAWLHDTIEDTDHTANDLLDEGFHRDVVKAVELLSKPKGCLHYLDWIDGLITLGTLPALLVKLADIEDNSDPARLAALDEATRARLEKKYHPARDRLRAAIERKS